MFQFPGPASPQWEYYKAGENNFYQLSFSLALYHSFTRKKVNKMKKTFLTWFMTILVGFTVLGMPVYAQGNGNSQSNFSKG